MNPIDEAIYERVLKIENKDVFVDLKSNQNGVYLKISERNGNNRNSILIPASGIKRLGDVIQEISQSAEFKQITQQYAGEKGVSPLRAERDSNLEVKERSVYVSNLSWNTDENKLTQHMSQAGAVVQSVILRRNMRSMGCGIVEYATSDMACRAVELLNDSELEGRSIHVREDKVAVETPNVLPSMNSNNNSNNNYSNMSKKTIGAQKVTQPREDKVIEPNKVFVSNLPWTTSEEELIAAFCSIGDVVGVQIRHTRGGRSLGCGVVEFSNSIYAQNCIHTMNGQDFNGRSMAVREYYQ